ncbi:MarR family transcriptional regulator [Aureimonas sp. ME7]|uniref:MarR family winged helix-turn-helix transcriptional regulator n=1 Tax=Aureimonas sp. ME7 TaxID=2744252 RepID=UPI0015FE2875|nr:MarR family transcriptional regulator [Aureimonas sp. ME7]
MTDADADAGHVPELTDVEASYIGGILQLAKTTRAFMMAKLAHLGLHAGQDELLLMLDQLGEANGTRIAEGIGVRPSTVSKMLDRLAERQLIVRTRNTQDARKTTVCLSNQGKVVAEEVRQLHAAIDRELLACRKSDAAYASLGDIEHLTTLIQSRSRRIR